MANQKIFLDTGLDKCSREQVERIALQCYEQFYELLKGTNILFLISAKYINYIIIGHIEKESICV